MKTLEHIIQRLLTKWRSKRLTKAKVIVEDFARVLEEALQESGYEVSSTDSYPDNIGLNDNNIYVHVLTFAGKKKSVYRFRLKHGMNVLYVELFRVKIDKLYDIKETVVYIHRIGKRRVKRKVEKFIKSVVFADKFEEA